MTSSEKVVDLLRRIAASVDTHGGAPVSVLHDGKAVTCAGAVEPTDSTLSFVRLTSAGDFILMQADKILRLESKERETSAMVTSLKETLANADGDRAELRTELDKVNTALEKAYNGWRADLDARDVLRKEVAGLQEKCDKPPVDDDSARPLDLVVTSTIENLQKEVMRLRHQLSSATDKGAQIQPGKDDRHTVQRDFAPYIRIAVESPRVGDNVLLDGVRYVWSRDNTWKAEKLGVQAVACSAMRQAYVEGRVTAFVPPTASPAPSDPPSTADEDDEYNADLELAVLSPQHGDKLLIEGVLVSRFGAKWFKEEDTVSRYSVVFPDRTVRVLHRQGRVELLNLAKRKEMQSRTTTLLPRDLGDLPVSSVIRVNGHDFELVLGLGLGHVWAAVEDASRVTWASLLEIVSAPGAQLELVSKPG